MNKSYLLVGGLLAGTVIGEAIAILRMRKTCGTLLIDKKGEKELYRFEIDDFDGLSKRKYVRLKVNANADLSQD